MQPVNHVLFSIICYICMMTFGSASWAISSEQSSEPSGYQIAAVDIEANVTPPDVLETQPQLSTKGSSTASSSTEESITSVKDTAKDEANGVSALLAEELSRVAHMSASFTQQTVDRTLRVLQENTGRLWVNPGAKFRIETDAPSEQMLVSDGVNFWVYDVDLEQVIISKLEADVSQVPILLLGGNLSELNASYAVSYYEDELGQNYVLSPLSSENLFTSLSISFQQSIPVRIAIVDALGQRTLINFHDVIASDQIQPAIFAFEPPSGTDVIDDRI